MTINIRPIGKRVFLEFNNRKAAFHYAEIMGWWEGGGAQTGKAVIQAFRKSERFRDEGYMIRCDCTVAELAEKMDEAARLEEKLNPPLEVPDAK